MIDYGVDIPHYLECMDSSIYVETIEYGERKRQSGIIIPTETMDSYGMFVHPRWAKVKYKAKNIDFLEIGDWVLLKHGHWSTSMLMSIDNKETKIWYISPKSLREGLIAISKKIPQQMNEFGIN